MWYRDGYIYTQGPRTVKRISFLAFGPGLHYRGTIVTSESVEETLSELGKDFDVVVCDGIRLVNTLEAEDVTIFNATNNERIV